MKFCFYLHKIKSAPNVLKGWIQFTFIVESFDEEVSNTLDISIEVPVGK